MPAQQTVLLVGGTGRTGRRVLQQLLDRGVSVRAIVRSAAKAPARRRRRPQPDAWSRPTCCRCATRSCSGTFAAAMRSSRVSVTSSASRASSGRRATSSRERRRGCAEGSRRCSPRSPVKFILMSSVSVNRPGGLDTRRGASRGRFSGCSAASSRRPGTTSEPRTSSSSEIGTDNPFVQWVAVRPDTLLEGDVSEYTLHEGLVNSLFAPGQHQHGQRRALHVRAGDEPEDVGGLEGQAAGDRQRIACVTASIRRRRRGAVVARHRTASLEPTDRRSWTSRSSEPLPGLRRA